MPAAPAAHRRDLIDEFVPPHVPHVEGVAIKELDDLLLPLPDVLVDAHVPCDHPLANVSLLADHGDHGILLGAGLGNVARRQPEEIAAIRFAARADPPKRRRGGRPKGLRARAQLRLPCIHHGRPILPPFER